MLCVCRAVSDHYIGCNCSDSLHALSAGAAAGFGAHSSCLWSGNCSKVVLYSDLKALRTVFSKQQNALEGETGGRNVRKTQRKEHRKAAGEKTVLHVFGHVCNFDFGMVCDGVFVYWIGSAMALLELVLTEIVLPLEAHDLRICAIYRIKQQGRVQSAVSALLLLCCVRFYVF